MPIACTPEESNPTMEEIIMADDFRVISTLLYSPTLPSEPPASSPSSSTASQSAELSKFYMLPYHLDRLLASAKAFNWPSAISFLSKPNALSSLVESLSQHLSSKPAQPDSATASPPSYRIRLLVSRTGQLTIESTAITSTPTPSTHNGEFFPLSLNPPPTSSSSLPPAKIYLSPSPTQISLLTSHKTTYRPHYTSVRAEYLPNPSSPVTEAEILLHNPSNQMTEASLSTVYFFRDGRWVTPSIQCGGNIGSTRRWALERGLCVEGIVEKQTVTKGEGVWVSNGVRGFVWGTIQLE